MKITKLDDVDTEMITEVLASFVDDINAWNARAGISVTPEIIPAVKELITHIKNKTLRAKRENRNQSLVSKINNFGEKK